MNLLGAAGLVFAAGALGGVLNGLLVGARSVRPRYDDQKVWQPGWSGIVVIGAFAAVVMWALYGASASENLSDYLNKPVPLTLAQLATSLLTGIAGSSVLTSEARNLMLKRQRDFEEEAKIKTAQAALLLSQHQG